MKQKIKVCSHVLDKTKNVGEKSERGFFGHCFSDSNLRVNWIMDEIDEG